MTHVQGGPWPKSLASRLTLFLVIALALAQAGLTVFLSTQRDRVVEGLLHSQALNQTVTLTRLLNQYPQSESDHLAAAFGSRGLCAWVRREAPTEHSMTAQERQLALTLTGMLHGLSLSSSPLVSIQPATDERRHCDDTDSTDPSSSKPEDHGADRPDDNTFFASERAAALAMDVPMADGRWLSVRTRVDLPPDFDPVTIVSFLFSSLAVAIVVALVVRHQTRSLRALADASNRFGRGETVPALPSSGPVEVSTAIHAFNTMQSRLSEFIRDRLRLLASISHDLRTPITTLRLKAEFIDDQGVRDDLIKTIDELATICEATLAFTRAEATSEDTKVLDMSELLREVEQEFVLAGRPVEEARMDAVPCACRPVALKRAIRNLIENAIRYGHRAKVSVLDEVGHVIIRVDDDGPGIPSEKIEAAFEPFVRLETSRSTETGGLGLGLAISRSIVAAHGGKLQLQNLAGGGLRAEIALPSTR